MSNTRETTSDLLTMRHPIPGETTQPKPRMPEREQLNRRYGRIALTAGTTTITTTIGAVGLTPDHIISAVPHLAGEVIVMTALLTGFTGIILWGMEALMRYNRTLMRTVLTRIDAQDATLRELINGIEPFDDRLKAIEEKIAGVPDYAQGLFDGAAMRRTVIGPEDN